MRSIVKTLKYIILAFGTLLSLIVGYLLLLTGAALFAPRRTPRRGTPPTNRFVIMVPAHNEERLLPSLLENLTTLDYPRDLYQVHVVADNCTDSTATVGRQGGAIVHERFNNDLVGKGYALEWLLERIWENNHPHDAVLILDADTIVSPNFLSVMDARLARGERVVQAYYAVREPESSWSASLRSVALTVLHFLRPQGRMVLGGSTGLKGNGMVFATDIVRKHRWSASLTEDIEYHMDLILAGERVMFSPDALVWAEMPDSLRASQSQNVRWERGRLEMVRNYVPRLLHEAFARRSFLLFDAAIEQLIPPFSIVAAGSGAVLIGALLLLYPPGIILGLLLLLGQIIYILTGLILSGAPMKVYQALLYAPIFVTWKIWLYIRVIIGAERKGWVRTARNDSMPR